MVFIHNLVIYNDVVSKIKLQSKPQKPYFKMVLNLLIRNSLTNGLLPKTHPVTPLSTYSENSELSAE